MEVSVTTLIKEFSKFLNISMPLVQNIIKGHSINTGAIDEYIQDDWLQANWEFLVEYGLGVGIFLEVYGNGADCYGASSRITYNTALPTHFITCKSNSESPLTDLLSKNELLNEDTNLILDRLVAMTDDGWYAELSPFDKVLCRLGDDEVILNLDELEFSLSKIS